MTPLEKALNEPRGNYLTQADWMAGCIRAFLEAAAEDAGARVALQAAFYDNHSDTIAASRAAILALKDAING